MKKFIPNILTLSRAVVTFVIIVLFFLDFPGKFFWIYGLFIYGSLSDFFDGYLSRKWKVESTFGKVFDSLFDKIFTIAFYLLLMPFDIVHDAVFIALIVRELFVDGLKNYLISLKAAVSPKATGKLKFVFQVLMINFMILFLIYPGNEILQKSAFVSAGFALLFAYISAFYYIKDFYRYFKA